jgi:hypothetical protein
MMTILESEVVNLNNQSLKMMNLKEQKILGLYNSKVGSNKASGKKSKTI